MSCSHFRQVSYSRDRTSICKRLVP
ncbi:hypothetical protein LINGRAPRIM_LOCUS1735 [Linum grandiflorum]